MTGTEDCIEPTLVAALHAGALHPAEAAAIARHLGGCERCRSLVGDSPEPITPRSPYVLALPEPNDQRAWFGSGHEQTSLGTDMPRLGDVFADKYRIESLLGQGGAGAVYAGVHLDLGRRVAVKILHRSDETAQARFLREAQVCATLTNDCVPRIFDFGRLLDGRPYLVMEHLAGEDLARVVARERVELLMAIHFGIQICSALTEAHHVGVVHRDLKPSNLFLVTKGSGRKAIKILDFGISKLAREHGEDLNLTNPGAILGTPPYMSPEQLQSSKDIDYRTDIWSVGVILYELFTGRQPFMGNTLVAIALAIANEPAVPPSDHCPELTPDLDQIVLRCLEKDPSRRFQSASDLAMELESLLSRSGSGDSLDVSTRQVLSSGTLEPSKPINGGNWVPKPHPRQRNSRTATQARPSPLYGVPLPSQSFVGRRSELDRLRRAFEHGHVRLCASIEGLPGIGKTELALKLAHELSADGEFPGGIFWLPAESPDLTDIWASDSFAGALGCHRQSAKRRAAKAVNAVGRSRKPALVILDNVEQWDEEIQPTPIPSGPNVTLLVTTRRSHIGGSRFRSFRLDFLKQPDADALMVELAGPEVMIQPGFHELTAHLGGHALAVELSGTYLRERPDVSPAAYLAKLKESREFDSQVASDTRYERSVNDAFALLWQRLDVAARRYWQLASCFAAEPVSVALADACGLDADARCELRRYHLIESDSSGQFRMHRLIRSFGQLAGDSNAREEALHEFLAGVTEHAAMIDIHTAFAIYVPDRAHFERALVIARADPKAPERLILLLDRIGTALRGLVDLKRARELLEQAFQAASESLGEDHPLMVARLSNLAGVLHAQGHLLNARSLFEEALSLAEVKLGAEHPTIATIRSNLALVLKDLGDHAGARALLEQALAADLKNLGAAHPSVATRQSNLGTLLRELGELPRARELLEQSLDSGLALYGRDHPSVATRHLNLALILNTLGDLEGARSHLEQALSSDVALFGEDHPIAGTAFWNYGWLLVDLGERSRAWSAFEQALKSVPHMFEGHPASDGAELDLGGIVLRARARLFGDETEDA
jgi:serine/threonine protein kinase/tetratricopeptide (TPR) repeat protein